MMKRVEKIKKRMDELTINWFQLKGEEEVKRSIRLFDLENQVEHCLKMENALNQMPFIYKQKFDVFVNISGHFSFVFETTRSIAIITVPEQFHRVLKNGDKLGRDEITELVTLFRTYRLSAKIQITFLEEEV